MFDLLYIDDDLVDRMMFERSFRKSGWLRCTLASGKEELSASLESAYFDLILSDINLPDIEPDEIEELAGEIPILWTSGVESSDSLRKALVKPISEKALRQALGEIPFSIPLSTNPDLSYLMQVADGDTEFVNEMLGLFRKEVPEELQVLKKAILTADTATAAFHIHKLRSRLRILGLHDYKDLTDKLEPMFKSGQELVTATTLTRQLIRGLEIMLLYLNSENHLAKN